jgi:asparagine synthase (glutamine-hydrolysing)
MCAINGIICQPTEARADKIEMRRTRDFMSARGPDAKGEWFSADSRVALGHRRLSIVELSELGAQPMVSSCGDLVITFNGEIYNYKNLRRELEKKGSVFRGNSDTEVLLHLYLHYGDSMLKKLRGMYAFALYDARTRRLLLARDPYGIKPLYYTNERGVFRFASSVKALLAGGGVSREPDPAGVAGFYLMGSVPEPFTTFRAIRCLPAGSSMIVDDKSVREPEVHSSITAAICVAEREALDLPIPLLEQQLRDAFLDSVSNHLMSDVPVGAFLSAGVDSGAIVGLMRDAGQRNINTITLAFGEYQGTGDDESPTAEETARLYSTDHTKRVVTAREFAADLPMIIRYMDQPTVDGVNTWFVSKAASEIGLKVAMSGVGADELLGSYNTLHSMARLPRWLGLIPDTPFGNGLLRSGLSIAKSLGVGLHPKTAGIADFARSVGGAYFLIRGLFLPSELGEVIVDPNSLREGLERLDLQSGIEAAMQPQPVTIHGKICALESNLYLRNQLLRDTDWTGMAHSLEVRTPFVDIELLRRVMPLVVNLKQTTGKRLLAAAPRLGLPPEVLTRKRTGFGVPVKTWYHTQAVCKSNLNARSGNNVPWARFWAQEIEQRYSCELASPPGGDAPSIRH